MPLPMSFALAMLFSKQKIWLQARHRIAHLHTWDQHGLVVKNSVSHNLMLLFPMD